MIYTTHCTAVKGRIKAPNNNQYIYILLDSEEYNQNIKYLENI